MRKGHTNRTARHERPLRLMLGAILAAAGVLLGGCGGDSGAAEPEPSGAADTTAPEVTITSPAPGSTVSSPVTLIASVSDASGIAAVRFFVDGDLVEERTAEPWEAAWAGDPGSHSLRVEATDASAAANTASATATYQVVDGPGAPIAGEWDEDDFTTVHDVGPGKAFQELEDVPWETLSAGTLVRIHWREQPYRAKWVVNAAGTSNAPIVIAGMPNGSDLPVITGQDAVTRSQLSYPNQERSIIKIGGADRPSGNRAEWVFIENLVIEGANANNSFRDSDGRSRSYATNAASVHIQRGRNIHLRNNVLTNSGNGLFSGFESSQLVISGNRFEGNGNTGSASQHNSYTESLGIVYESNHFRPLRSGALGNNLKDRSAGTVIRYNWIESGARQLDLVDSDHGNIYGAAEYRSTFVYGNVLIEPADSNNGNIVHYGGDLSGRESTYRKGTLHFFNNTVISFRTDRASLFGMSSNEETADARNNVFYSPVGGQTLAITSGRGVIDLRGNWLQSGWSPSSGSLDGVVNDLGNAGGNNPGFADEAARDFVPGADSPLRDAGTGLSPGAAAHPLTYQYAKHQSRVARPVDGSVDAGAFEYPGTAAVPPPTITTSSLPDGVEDEPYSEFLLADDGTLPFAWSVTAGGLPDGLALEAESGEISGTPTASGRRTFTVRVTDAKGQTDSATLSIRITGDEPASDSVLPNYSSDSALTGLSFVGNDLSGITYAPDSNTFFLIQNNGGGIWEVDTSFTRLRTIQLSGAGDTEDIAYLGNNEFAIVEESSELLIGTIPPAATNVSAGQFQRVRFDSYSGNSGYEGVTYDPVLQTFYVVKESSPKRIRSFVRPSTSQDTQVSADTPFDANALPASDLSAVTLDTRTGRLLILSDESHKLMDVGLDGVVHGQLFMADSSQHEGVALDAAFNIYVTSEPSHWRRYSQ